MPEPVRGDQKYLPGLDGLRALAVACVVAYHLGYGWAQGGLLGVGVFFTLSGYLITDILAGQWAARGRIKLGDFWLRRARRLLPALFVMLAVVAVWVNAFARSNLPGFRGDVIASGLYVSNWWYIGQHASYYARFSAPAPLDHLWSLAVEEQFYLIWPWVVLLLVWLAGRWQRRGRGPAAATTADPGTGSGSGFLSMRARWAIAGVTLGLAIVSAIEMAVLYQPGYDPTRIYEGTDTRACGLLIGAALAMIWPTRRPGRGSATPAGADAGAGDRVSWRARTGTGLLDAGGVAGLAVIGVLVWRTNQYSGFMFRGGLVLLSVATALVVAAVATPGSLLGRALGCGPLRWLGVRSYGIYLWHYPIILLTVPAVAGAVGSGAQVSPARAVALVAATVAVAAASWALIEEPIRRGRRSRRPATAPAGAAAGSAATGPAGAAATGTGAGRWRAMLPAWTGAAPAGGANATGTGGPRRPWPLGSPLALASLCLLTAGCVAAGVTAATSQLSSSGSPSVTATVQPTKTAHASGSAGARLSRSASKATATASALVTPGAATVPALPTPPPRTSCTSVVHIGDSTSEGLTSPDYLPNPADRIPARYADVGVKTSIMRIVGATSVVESLPGTPNAYTMASQLVHSGYHGCWVLALGTNDTADVYVGSNVNRVQRIKEMMGLIGNQPVMWVEVKSLVSSGPYSEQNMELWNQALKQELPHYKNMQIYDWPAAAQNSWFISDGIHYTSIGYEHRAKLIADALAEAFPAS